MLINELKYASAIRFENGEAKRFDDIGCMIDYLNKNNSKIKMCWIYDFINKKPMHAEDAYFVYSKALTTPMGFGIIGLKLKEQAATIADKYKVEIISFNEVENKYHKLKTE